MIASFLKGKVRLVITYWVFGVIPGWIIFLLDVLIEYDHPTIWTFAHSALFIAYVILPFIYFPFVYIAIWNSANNYIGSKIWASLARISVIVSSIILVFSLYATISIIHENLFSQESLVANEIDELNRNLPTMIDDETELQKISYHNKTLFYYFRLTNYEASEININDFSRRMREQLLKNTCNGKHLKPFISNGDSVSFNYVGKSGNRIKSFTIKPADCK